MSVRHDEGVASAGYGGSGANEFTFSGAGTTITFFPATPGPVVAGQTGVRTGSWAVSRAA